jgi:membrane protein
MKRFLDVFLGALAVGGAVAAVRSTAPVPAVEGAAPESAGSIAAPVDRPSAAAGVVAAVSPAPTGLRLIKDLALAVAGRLKAHGTVMLAAGLSYYSLLAVFPAAIAAVSIWGLVADPAELERQITDLTSALPVATAEFVETQILGIVDTPSGTLGVTTTLSILAALWSASAGTKALLTGINYAYGHPETRSFLAIRFAALVVTIGMIVFGLGALMAVGFLPQILAEVGLKEQTADLINFFRWPAVFLIVILGLGALYKLAPNRPWRATRWINVGAVTAATLWVLATVGLSFYVNNFGASFGATYGALAGLIVLMLWFFVSGLIILVGAELNSELEHRRPHRGGHSAENATEPARLG